MTFSKHGDGHRASRLPQLFIAKDRGRGCFSSFMLGASLPPCRDLGGGGGPFFLGACGFLMLAATVFSGPFFKNPVAARSNGRGRTSPEPGRRFRGESRGDLRWATSYCLLYFPSKLGWLLALWVSRFLWRIVGGKFVSFFQRGGPLRRLSYLSWWLLYPRLACGSSSESFPEQLCFACPLPNRGVEFAPLR